MDNDEIARVYARHPREAGTAVSPAEAAHVRDLVREHRPSSFVEVGTASGLFTGLVAEMMAEHGGGRLLTLDHRATFTTDGARPPGYLVPLVHPSGQVAVEQRHGTSMDLPGGEDTFEVAFVDARREHPWPLIDTLCLAPVLTGPRLVVHRDLNLYRHQALGRGLGPKVVFDQFPPSHRARYAAEAGNLFSVRLALPPERLARRAMDGLAVPWTLTRRIGDDDVDRICTILAEHYPERVRGIFERCCQRYNVPTGHAYGVVEPPEPPELPAAEPAPSLVSRLLRRGDLTSG